MNIQAVILAGGLGTRLRPITEKIPKPLVPVNGKPYLHWQLEELKKMNVKRVLLLCAYLGEMVREEFGDGKQAGLEISYSFETEPMGTGGALTLSHNKLDEEFLLINGDSFLRFPLEGFVSSFKERKLSAMMSSFERFNETSVKANLKVQNQIVTEYKKGAGIEQGFNAIDSGVYMLNKNILRQGSQKYQLEELWPDLIRKQKLGVFGVDEIFYDIGTPEGLEIFERKLSDYFPHAF